MRSCQYFFDDDQQFPDTQYAVFEYAANDGSQRGKKQLIFEQRIWSPYVQEGYENGAAFYGTKGQLLVGHTRGWRMYGERNKLITTNHPINWCGGNIARDIGRYQRTHDAYNQRVHFRLPFDGRAVKWCALTIGGCSLE